jgi:hypothetical protein
VVGQPTNVAAPSKSIPPVCVAVLLTFGPPLGVLGVGHEVQSLPDVRRPEARSAGIERPDGVALCFQVSVNSVEPSKSVL